MCVVSMVIDGWRNPFDVNHVKQETITPQIALQMLDIIARLEKLDQRLNAIDCKLKEAEKTEYKNMLRERAKKKRRAKAKA